MIHNPLNCFILNCLVVMTSLLSLGAQAHHSYAIYDIVNPVEVEGEVVRFRFSQPHPLLVLRETKDSGETVEWTFEGVSIMMWNRLDLPRDIVEPGEMVTVRGWPDRLGKPKMLLSGVIRESGEEIVLLEEVMQREGRLAAGLDVEGEPGQQTLEIIRPDDFDEYQEVLPNQEFTPD